MTGEEYRVIRDIPLLEEEEVWLALDSRYGLLEEPPPKDDFLALTSQRIIGVASEDGRQRRILLPVHSVDAVEVTDPSRSTKPLVTGGLLILAALGVTWATAALGLSGALPWLIAIVMAVLGAVTASTYFVKEETAAITFRARAADATLPLRTPQAVRGAFSMANGFFQIRAGGSPTQTVGGRVASTAPSAGDASEAPPSAGAASLPAATPEHSTTALQQATQGEDRPAHAAALRDAQAPPSAESERRENV